MPGIDLSTLSGPELRRLLDVARTRGQDGLAAELLAEIDARGAGLPRAAASNSDGPTPRSPTPEPDLPLDRGGGSRRRRRRMLGLGVMAVGAAGAALAWTLSSIYAPVPPRSQSQPQPQPRAMIARTAPVATEAPPLPVVQPPPDVTRRPKPEVKTAPSRRDPCATAPTPADRLVCSDLGLAQLHRELLEAYAHALNARVDPTVVNEDQAAWRRARAGIADPTRLGQLYADRIRELNAAASARQKPVSF